MSSSNAVFGPAASAGGVMVSWFVLLVFAVIGLLLLIGLASLLANQKTRVLGMVLMLLAVPPVLLFGTLFAFRVSHQPAPPAQVFYGADGEYNVEGIRDYQGTIPVSSQNGPAARTTIQSQRVAVTPPPSTGNPKAPTATKPVATAPARAQAESQSTLRALASAFVEPLRRELQARKDVAQAQAEKTLTKAGVESVKRTDVPITATAAATPPGTAKATAAATAPGAKTTAIPVESTEPAKPDAASKKTRPAWVDGPDEGVVDGEYQMVVMAGPYDNKARCDEEMRKLLPQAVRKFAARQLRISEQEAAQIDLPLDYIRTQVVKEQYVEPRNTELGPWTQVNALLRFDSPVKARIDQEWNQIRVSQRLWTTGEGLAGLLWLLAVAYGYLKIDLATKGNYRGRLRLGATALVAGAAAVGLALLA